MTVPGSRELLIAAIVLYMIAAPNAAEIPELLSRGSTRSTAPATVLSMAFDPFEVLGVRPGATQDQIRAAYKEQVARYHPDKHKGNPLEDLAGAKLVEINRAYEMLVERANRRREAEGAAPARRSDGASPGTKLVRSVGLIVTLLLFARFGVALGRQFLALVRGMVVGILWIVRLSPVLGVAVIMGLALCAGMLLRSRKGHG